MKNARRTIAIGASVAAVLAVAGCSTDPGASEGTAAEPTVIDFWGWNQGQTAMVEAFNNSHDTVKLKYTQYPGNADLLTGLSNAVTADADVPCLVQAPGTGTAMGLLAKGLIQPITSYLEPSKDKFFAQAYDAQRADGEVYGIPFVGGPQFMMINDAVYQANGLAAPTTWDDLLAIGGTLKGQGTAVLNFAGEDPTTFSAFANQAGATWFQIDGDSWVVDIDSPETQKAADLLQKFVDGGLVTNETFADIPAMSQTYDAGKMIDIPLTTWNLAAWQTRLSSSLGSWRTIDLPQYADSDTFVVPGQFNAYVVPEGCDNPKAATEAGVFLATDPASLAIATSPTEGAGNFPATPDASQYVDAILPPTLLGSTVDQTPAVISKAADSTRVQWIDSPSATFFDEMVSQWAKAINKQITFREMATHLQEYVVKDLESQGITVKQG